MKDKTVYLFTIKEGNRCFHVMQHTEGRKVTHTIRLSASEDSSDSFIEWETGVNADTLLQLGQFLAGKKLLPGSVFSATGSRATVDGPEVYTITFGSAGSSKAAKAMAGKVKVKAQWPGGRAEVIFTAEIFQKRVEGACFYKLEWQN